MKCGCHPNCGTGTALLISKKTKEWAPLSDVFNVERFFSDARSISDAARSPLLTKIQTGLSVVRNSTHSRERLELPAQLRAEPCAKRPQARRPHQEVRQTERRIAWRIRHADRWQP